MKRVILFTFFVFAGFLAYAIWLSGPHEHSAFRPNMKEDWALIILLIVCWGGALFILIQTIYRIFKS